MEKHELGKPRNAAGFCFSPLTIFHFSRYCIFPKIRILFIFPSWLLALGSWLLCSPAHAQERELTTLNPIRIVADYLAYNADENQVQATGNVVLIYKRITVRADRLILDLNARVLQAEGIGGRVQLSRELNEEPVASTTTGFNEALNLSVSDAFTLFSPEENEVFTQPRVDVSGNVQGQAAVFIGGELVPVEPGGRFSKQVPLESGVNRIEVVVRDENGNVLVRETRSVVYNPSLFSSLSGDKLRFDFDILGGYLLSMVNGKLQWTYFSGEEFQVVGNPIRAMSGWLDKADLKHAKLSMVAKRMEIILGLEDYLSFSDVSFYVKGLKTFSAPSWSTDIEGALGEVPFQPTSLDYASKNGMTFGSRYLYAGGKKFYGRLILDYQQKFLEGKERQKSKWNATVEQRFTLGKRREGVLVVRRLLEDNWNGSISYNHYFSKNLDGTLSFTLTKNESIKDRILGKSLSLRRRFRRSDLLTTFSHNQPLEKGGEDYSLLVALSPVPTQVPKTKITLTRQLSTRFSVAKTLNSRTGQVKKASASSIDFNFNVHRNGIPLFGKATLSLISGLSVSSARTGDSFLWNGSASMIYPLQKQRGHFLSLYYASSYGLQTQSGFRPPPSRSKNLTFSFSMGNVVFYQANGSIAYDLLKGRFGTTSPFLQIVPHHLVRASINADYSFIESHWTRETISVFYNLFGMRDRRRLQFSWTRLPKTGEENYLVTFTNGI